jgi:hypothetical protein
MLMAIFSSSLYAAENSIIPLQTDNNLTTLSVSDDWISVNRNESTPIFVLKTKKSNNFGDVLAFGWNVSDSLMVNLSVFENRLTPSINKPSNNELNYSKNFYKSFTKMATPINPVGIDVNRNLSGYKFGISSKIGMGNNYTLNIDFDYGQLADANLVGFSSQDVSTSSFEFGFRKSKFGASILSDTYLDDKIDTLENTRLGFELDWYFSDNTTLSFGSKQRINKSTQKDISSSLDSLTGDVQYIKFQHNL